MQAFNPYLPSYEYVPDGEPHVFGDRVYVYGSHDAFNGADFCVNDYVCYSADVNNLADWRFDGVIYKATQDPRNADGSQHLCAPDCAEKNGKYYLYYQLHMLQCTCVAVADNPAGPFEYYGCVQHTDGTPWGEKAGDSFAFDPAILVDDDGKNYLYVGFSPIGQFRELLLLRKNNIDGAVCLELADDMKTVISDEMQIAPGEVIAEGTGFEGHGFFEASSIRKANGKYYYVYSSILSHELCYAVSDYPNRGFQYGGTIVSITDIGLDGNKTARNYAGNTHGGMVEVNGQWYIFYHRQTNKQKCARQGCAEKIEILPDGNIPQVEITSCGLNNGPLLGKGYYSAHIACNLMSSEGTFPYLESFEKDEKGLHPYFTQTGDDREDNPDQYIANMKNGAIAGFKYFDFKNSDASTVSITVSGAGRGFMDIFDTLDCVNCLARVRVDFDNTTNNRVVFSSVFKKPDNKSALFFKYSGEGCVDFIGFELK